jgi:hypothetical protein
MTKIRNPKRIRFGHWILELRICLACLREAASAKAGICNLGFGILGGASDLMMLIQNWGTYRHG